MLEGIWMLFRMWMFVPLSLMILWSQFFILPLSNENSPTFIYHMAWFWAFPVLGGFCRDVRQPLWVCRSLCRVQLVCFDRGRVQNNTQLGVEGQGLRRWPFWWVHCLTVYFKRCFVAQKNNQETCEQNFCSFTVGMRFEFGNRDLMLVFSE